MMEALPMATPLQKRSPSQFRDVVANWRLWAILSGVAVGVGVMGVLNDSLTLLIAGQSPALNLTYWRLWWLMLSPIPFGVLSWYIAERVPVRWPWTRTLAVHVIAAFVLSYLRVALLA